MLTLYCPPSDSDEENVILIEIILEFCQDHKVVVLRDFNLTSLVWSAGDGKFRGASQRDHLFLDCFAVSSFTQWLMEPTFVSSGNTFDLFLTSNIII